MDTNLKLKKITTTEAGGIRFSHKYDASFPAEINTWHCHDNYEILLLLEGKGRYIVDGCEYRVSPGSVMFTRPFEYHCIDINPDTPYERSVISFNSSSVSEEALGLLREQQGESGGCFYPPQAISPLFISLFERYQLGLSLPEREKELYIKYLTSELVVLLSATKVRKIDYEDEDIGTRVRRYINEHITHDIKLDELSKIGQPFDDNINYKRAFRYGDEALKQKLLDANKANTLAIVIQEEHERILKEQATEAIYQESKQLISNAEGADFDMANQDLEAAKELLSEILGYKDSAALLKECEQMIMYNTACKKMHSGNLYECEEALHIFEKIVDYKDSKEKIEESKKLKESTQSNNTADFTGIIVVAAIFLIILLIICIVPIS